MLRSDAPCAIARTFTPARARAENSRAATPGEPAMPSPTTASVVMPGVALTSTSWPAVTSRENVCRRWSRAAYASRSWTTQQIECSELPCEIITTEIPASRKAPNARSAVPGTPIIPAPSMLMSARPEKIVTPLIGWLASPSAVMRVPGRSGAKVLRMTTGMPRLIAGDKVCGWMTFAPKYASSQASE